MDIDNRRMDIRVLKYENYIKEHPDKPYGYYSLGKLKLILNQYKQAERLFYTALSLNSNYTNAKIGILELYIYRKKFIKSVSFYNKYCSEIKNKHVFKNKLVKAATSYYDKINSAINIQQSFSLFYLRYTQQHMRKLSRRNYDNIVATLILCMYYLSINSAADNALSIYSKCVALDGLNDNMRWKLIKALTKSDPSIIHNTEIAGKFSNITGIDFPNEYINTLFEAVLAEGKIKETKKVYKYINKNTKSLSPSNMWKYVLWCEQNSVSDASVYQCCVKLLKLGWVDKLVAQTIIRLQQQNTARGTEYEDKILKLYGYRN